MKALILIALIAFTYCDDDDDDNGLSPNVYSYDIDSNTGHDNYQGQFQYDYPLTEIKTSSVKYVCPDDKIQLKDDVCAIVESSEIEIEVKNLGKCNYPSYYTSVNPGQSQTFPCTTSATSTDNNTYTINIKKKCGKNQKCVVYTGYEDDGERP